MASRRNRARRAPPGTAPGTLIADPDAPAPEIQVISYGPDTGTGAVSRRKIASLRELPATPPAHGVCWIDVAGLGDRETIQTIGERFGLHPLALEDTLNVRQRPKVEDYGDHLFIVTRMPTNAPVDDDASMEATGSAAPGQTEAAWARHAGQLATEQVTLFVGRGFVITFQERPGDVFEPVRARIAKGAGRIRSRGADYLAYALLDAAIDSFFPLLEVYGERVEDLEQEVVERPEPAHIARIHDLKRDLLTARRTIWPQREMLSTLVREEWPLVTDETRIFLRDCYDHSIQLMDMIETYREIASALIDVQLSSVSNRMNEVMKVLTMIATVFIPLTFIAGVYGMNFDPAAGPWSMPELGWRYGYPATLLGMAAIGGGLLFWFRRKGWLGRRRRDRDGS
jgi:magnesium transporter